MELAPHGNVTFRFQRSFQDQENTDALVVTMNTIVKNMDRNGHAETVTMMSVLIVAFDSKMLYSKTYYHMSSIRISFCLEIVQPVPRFSNHLIIKMQERSLTIHIMTKMVTEAIEMIKITNTGMRQILDFISS